MNSTQAVLVWKVARAVQAALGESVPSLLGLGVPLPMKAPAEEIGEIVRGSDGGLHAVVCMAAHSAGWVHGKEYSAGDLTHPDLTDWSRLSVKRQKMYSVGFAVLLSEAFRYG